MSALKEFLQSDADRILAEAKAEEERYAEWDRSVEGLFAQVEGWIREADAKQVIQLVRDEYHPFGPLNRKQKRLAIAIGKHRASIEAKSPHVLGGVSIDGEHPAVKHALAGQADLVGGDHTYSLYLLRTVEPERWFIRTGPGRVKPLDRNTFEHLLTDLLQ
jgi:hypothetical protein